MRYLKPSASRRGLFREFDVANPHRNLLINLGWTVYNRVRERLAADANWLCSYCGARVIVGRHGGPRLATIDHKTPLSRGGTWKRYNLTCACRLCNETKGSMTAEEFMELPAYLREIA